MCLPHAREPGRGSVQQKPPALSSPGVWSPSVSRLEEPRRAGTPSPAAPDARFQGGRGSVGKEGTLPAAHFLCSQAPAPCSESHSQGGVPLLEAISLPAAVGGPALSAEGEHTGLRGLGVAAGDTGAGARPRPQSREAFGAFCESGDMLLRFVHVWHQRAEPGCLLGRP